MPGMLSSPVVWNASPPMSTSTLVSKPTAALEQVAKKVRVTNSYRRFFSALQLASPAEHLMGWMGG